MFIKNPDGTITTDEGVKVDHYPYPCPPAGIPGISCEEAWERYAKQAGRQIVRKEPNENP